MSDVQPVIDRLRAIYPSEEQAVRVGHFAGLPITLGVMIMAAGFMGGFGFGDGFISGREIVASILMEFGILGVGLVMGRRSSAERRKLEEARESNPPALPKPLTEKELIVQSAHRLIIADRDSWTIKRSGHPGLDYNREWSHPSGVIVRLFIDHGNAAQIEMDGVTVGTHDKDLLETLYSEIQGTENNKMMAARLKIDAAFNQAVRR